MMCRCLLRKVLDLFLPNRHISLFISVVYKMLTTESITNIEKIISLVFYFALEFIHRLKGF